MSSPATPVPIDQLLAHREWVRRVARAMVHDENDADDLEQALWLDALERPPRSGHSLRGWLFTALRRDSANARRAESHRARREQATARAEEIPSAEELIAKADAHKRVVDAVMELAETYRSTVLYRFFEDLPPSAIAERQGVPVETVRTRLKRALAQLRSRLDAESGGDRGAWTPALAPLLDGSGVGSAGSSVPASVAGGLAMKTTTKLAISAVLLLLGGTLGWELGGVSAARDGTASEVGDADAREAAAGSGVVDAEGGRGDPPRSTADASAESSDAASAGRDRSPGRADSRATAPAATPPATSAAPRSAATAVQPVAPAPPPEDGEVVGRVLLAPRRTPVAGAVVTWQGPRRDRSVPTDRDGVFRIVVGQGDATLRATVDGHAPREIRVKVPATGGVSGVDIVFGDGGALEGWVVGRDGVVANAELFVYAGRGGFAEAKTSTDGEGHYRFDDVPAGAMVYVGLRMGDVLRRRYADVVSGATTRLDFDLGQRVPQASLSGRITDRGWPVMGLIVQVRPARPEWTLLDTVEARSTTTDAGEYSVQGLPAGEYRVSIERFAHGSSQSVTVKTVTLTAGENRFDVALGEGEFASEVSGRLLKKDSGAPAEGVSLSVYSLEERAPGAWVSASTFPAASGSTFAKGEYVFRGLPPGRYRLAAWGTTVDFDLGSGERKKLDVSVESGARESTPSPSTLSGALLDAAGLPVARGMLDAYAAETGSRSRGFTDNSGRYSVDMGPGPLLPGRCQVFYTGIDFDAEVAETTIVAGANTLDLRLGAGEVSGRVHARADGRGLGQVEVTLTASAVLPDGSVRYVGVARPQPDGTFRCRGLRDGRLRLVAWPRIDGLRPATADVEIEGSRPVRDVDLSLEAAPTGTVALVVHDDSGAELRWIVLESVAGGRPVQGSRTRLYSVTSTYALPVAPGAWAFSLWTEDGRLAGTASGEVRAGAAVRADVVLHPRASTGTSK